MTDEEYYQTLLHSDEEYNLWLNRRNEMDMTKYAGSESKYLKASDLQGKRPKVKISSIKLLEFEDEEKGKHTKPVLMMDGKEKGVVLNATNCEEMIRAFGKDSDEWVGKEIILSTKYYKAFDREGIVVTPQVSEDEFDDSIPF